MLFVSTSLEQRKPWLSAVCGPVHLWSFFIPKPLATFHWPRSTLSSLGGNTWQSVRPRTSQSAILERETLFCLGRAAEQNWGRAHFPPLNTCKTSADTKAEYVHLRALLERYDCGNHEVCHHSSPIPQPERAMASQIRWHRTRKPTGRHTRSKVSIEKGCEEGIRLASW